MRLGSGPIKVRIELEDGEGSELLTLAQELGLVLAAPGETPELVARLPQAAAAPETAAVGRPLTANTAAKRPALGIARASAALSPRELEIVDYLVDGWSNAEIASALRIGQRTVRFHLEGIFAKLGVSRRGEAVREAVRLGLVRFDV